MKNSILILFLGLSPIFLYCQDYTEKYNSLYGRYEYYDSNNNLIGYKKYNSLYERWDYYDLKSTSQQLQPVNPIDWNQTYQALSSSQQRYDSNKVFFKQEIDKLYNSVTNSNTLSVDEKNIFINTINNSIKEINSKNGVNFLDSNEMSRAINYIYQNYNNTINNINNTRKRTSIETRTKTTTKTSDSYSKPVTKKTSSSSIPEVDLLQKNIIFEGGSSTLTKESKVALNDIAQHLKNSNGNFEIQVHTDDVGSDANNLALSQKRAQTVFDYLVSKGVNGSRLKAVGYGESQPKYDNKTADGRAKNRRIEIVTID